jgi:hypothetical protein
MPVLRSHIDPALRFRVIEQRPHERAVARPSDFPAVMFMRNCAAPARSDVTRSDSFVQPTANWLHVLTSPDHIIVTECDDLHRPGRVICGQRIFNTPKAEMFRLLSTPVPGIGVQKYCPAAGVATLSWRDGKRRLKVSGVAHSMSCETEVIFDAAEVLFRAETAIG